jgi:hypothetical protein
MTLPTPTHPTPTHDQLLRIASRAGLNHFVVGAVYRGEKSYPRATVEAVTRVAADLGAPLPPALGKSANASIQNTHNTQREV